jgi:hypothetical protein
MAIAQENEMKVKMMESRVQENNPNLKYQIGHIIFDNIEHMKI